MMKNIFLLILLCSSTFSFTQSIQKQYKYIIVPLEYNFTTEPNQFQLNVLTRVMLKDEGFEVYMNQKEDKPQRLDENRCLALIANVIKDSGIFTTKLIFQLKDCYGKIVFESSGTSRQKPFKEAYQEALKKAIREFQMVSSQYLLVESNEETQISSDLKSNSDINNKIPFEERSETYKLGGQIYWLLQKGENYTLFTDNGQSIYANIEYAGQGSYSFDSANIDGAAFFDANGNLIVEYLAKDKDSVQKLEFIKQ